MDKKKSTSPKKIRTKAVRRTTKTTAKARNTTKKATTATRVTAKRTATQARARAQKAAPAVRKAVDRANKKLSVAMAAWILSASTFVSMLAGLWRERLLNANFYYSDITNEIVGQDLDAYRVAFKIPDLVYFIFVAGALSVTFIPVFRDRIEAGNRKSAWELTYSLINFLAIVTSIFSLAVIAFAPQIVEVMAPGLAEDPEIRQKTINMMRIISLNPLIFAISSVLASVQQAVGRFVFFSLSPIIYNAGIIIGILYFGPSHGIQGVVYGVLLGALAQLVISIVGIAGLGFKWRPIINRRNMGFRQVVKLLPSRSFDQGMDFAYSIFVVALLQREVTNIANPINIWETAQTLHLVPISLIGVALSTAAFPQMSKRISQNRPDLFQKDFRDMLHVILWLALPVAMFAFFGRGYLVRLLIGQGQPTIAYVLGILSISIFFRAIFHITARAFYAQKDIRTPLIISFVTIMLSVILTLVFVNMGNDAQSKISGAALALAIGHMAEVILLLLVLEHRFQGIFDRSFAISVLKVIAAVALTIPVTYALIRFIPLRVNEVGFLSLGTRFGAIVGVSAVWYLLVSWALNIREVQPILDKIRSVLFAKTELQ